MEDIRRPGAWAAGTGRPSALSRDVPFISGRLPRQGGTLGNGETEKRSPKRRLRDAFARSLDLAGQLSADEDRQVVMDRDR